MATPFQNEVYKVLLKIPKGHVTTYGEIARYLNTKAVRAVGTAVGKNPNAPTVPCHRVVPGTGKIGNYSGEGGVETKRALLMDEGIVIDNDKILNFEDVLYTFS